METVPKHIVQRALNDKEYNTLKRTIINKIERIYDKEIGQCFAAKAASETKLANAEHKISNLEKTVQEISQQSKSNLEKVTENFQELEKQIEQYRNEVARLNESRTQAEHEAAEFKKQRDAAIDENSNYQMMLERRSSEIERLQTDLTSVTTQLQTAISTKCEQQVKSEEIESMKRNLDFREKVMEKEQTLLKNQVESLTNELNARVSDLMNIRHENASQMLTLQSLLDEKTEELNKANESNKTLTEKNNELSSNLEKMIEQQKTEREKETRFLASHKQELQSQTNLAKLYEEMYEDSKSQIEMLTNGVAGLQKLLSEAGDQYGELETKYNQEKATYEDLLAKKNENIELLKKELEDANTIIKNLQDQKLENVIENLAPSAASTAKLIKKDISFTELYSSYLKQNEELLLKDAEIKRLNSYIETICHELDEKAPLLAQQKDEYEQAILNVQKLTRNNDELMSECSKLREKNNDFEEMISRLEKQLDIKATSEENLSRQICVLLQQIQDLQSASSSMEHESDTDFRNCSDIAAKKLVTFADIVELQENNKKLLCIYHELTHYDKEKDSQDDTVEKLQQTVEKLREDQTELLKAQENQTKMLTNLIRQRDKYKEMYQQAAMTSFGNDSRSGIEESSQNMSQLFETSTDQQKELEQLKSELVNTEKIMRAIKEEYENYQKEKSTNETMTMEQLEKLQEENKSLTQKNCKLTSTIEYKDEQLKISKTNLEILKQRNEILEKKNETYNNIIMKHEQSIKQLTEEILSSQTKLSHAEVLLDNVRQENKLLKDTENRLLKEREALHRESHGQSLLLNNLESIKAAFERTETEGKIRLEARLDEANRELSSSRRRLQEEQNRFRELSSHLEKQLSVANSRVNEEKTENDKLRRELQDLRKEITEKNNQIEEILKKHKESIEKEGTPLNEKVKNLKKQLDVSETKAKQLEQELQALKTQSEQYCNISQTTEKELRELSETHKQYKQASEIKIQSLTNNETNWKQRIAELQKQISQKSFGDTNSNDLTNQLVKAKDELLSTKQEVETLKAELQAMKSEILQLNSNLQATEDKYSREMVLHSNDIQALASLKEEVQKLRKEREELNNAKEDALKSLTIGREGWENREQLLANEKREIQLRLEELDKQNAILHNQLQTLTNQLTTQQNQQKSSEQLNMSINTSFTEEEAKSAEQLLQIIKFLRREVELQHKKFDLLSAENSRIRLEHESLTKQLEEAKIIETDARVKTNSEIVTAAKYNEILRKVETLNAITDSNRILREERDKLARKVDETTEKISQLERELAPLKESNRELSVKAEVAQKENVSLKAEATRWRQRANSLIERANKTTPEDWRRLQTERENLAKLLMTEKENVKKANEQKLKVEQQVTILQRQVQLQNEQSKKATEDINNLTQQNTKINQELAELRTTNTRLTEENAKLYAEVENKTKEMKTLMTKYVSVRALARKYKVQVEEEKTPEASGSQQDTTISSEIQEQYREEGRREATERMAALEKVHNEKLQELNAQIVSSQEENTKLSQMHDKLRQETNSKYERSQIILKSAKTKILKLNETNENLTRELNDLRSRLECQDVDARFAMVKSQYEAKLARLEKEKNECLTERQSDRERSSRDIETLNNHLNQLQRQLSAHGSGSKPSTSSGSSEKEAVSLPPTANIKPMAGTSQQQQSASINPRRKEDTPFASIRPMAMPSRTTTGVATLFPTTAVASSCPTSSPSAAIPPQQQVHTTGNSSIDTLSSSSPTSSHTDYMPATSSANITPIRQATVPPTQQSVITIGVGEETPSAAESTQDMEAETVDSIQQEPQVSQQVIPQAAVALVLPRVEQPSEHENQQIAEQSTSSSSSIVVVSSQQASSSSSVTTTQASFKRTREANEGDSSTGNTQIDQARIEPQAKRSRVQVVTESGTTEIEYQVPTSSQRDQEDDIVCVDSDEEDDEDEADGQGVEEPDDGPYTGDNEGFEAEGLTYDQELTSYENAEAIETVQQDVDNNEVDFIEQIISAESDLAMRNSPDYAAIFPSGSGNSTEAGSSSGAQAESADGVESAQSEAISSASGESNVTASLLQPGYGLRSRNITPLVRQPQQMVITGHSASGFEEQSGDDGIVPSTPTLYVPRRMDGFGEAVSSPHVPNSGRFTFNDPPATTTVDRNISDVTEPSQIEIVDESRMDQLEESGTGRSVPTTPLQVSPQGDTPQTVESNIASGSGIRSTGNQAGDSQSQSDTSSSIPDVVVSEVCSLSNLPEVVPTIQVASAEAEAHEMAPPPTESVAGTSSDSDAHQTVGDTDVEEGSDGVSSEGEKVVSAETPKVEEGREAEASQSPSSNSGMTRGGRISVRSYYRGGNRARDNVHRPIIWNDPQNRAATRSVVATQQQQQSPYQQRGMRGRRGSRRPQSNNYMRY